jgi:hypothetical protein
MAGNQESRVVTLINWSTTATGSPYSAPEQVLISLSGEVHGHNRFEDGDVITTSAVKGSSGRIVLTENTTYRLVGDPNPDWLRFLDADDITVCLHDPIRFISGAFNELGARQ